MPNRPGCCWIIGEPRGAHTRFCGRPTVDGVWCAHHHRQVYAGFEPPEEPPPEEPPPEEPPAGKDALPDYAA